MYNLQFFLPLGGCTGIEGALSQWKMDVTPSLEHCKTQLVCPYLARMARSLEIVSKTLSTLSASLQHSGANHCRSVQMETSILDGAVC